MLVYQVLLLPCALLALHLASARAQCPQSSVAVNAPCGQAAISCNVPYVPQNGACVLPFPTPSGCGSGQVCANGVVVHVFPSGFTNAQSVNSLCPNQPVQPQPAPCPNQPVIPYPPAQSQPAPCPNQPVTPYPPAQSQPAPCPDQPVTPYPPVQPQPAPCPNQPVNPYPPAQPQPAPCPNQPVTPYPPVQPQPAPCPNQPVTPYPPAQSQPAPCPNQPVTPYPPVQPQPAPCPNQPVTPYPPAQPQPAPCPNQPVTPYPPVQPQPAPCPNQPVTPYPPAQSQPAPCPNQPVTPYPPVPPETTNRPYQPPTTTTRETTTTWKTTTTRTTTTTPPPAPLRICPRGTVLINDNCRLVYCGSKVYSNGRCVEPRCPKGTYWTGQKCALPEPIELSPINLQRTIINENSKNTPDLVLNNVQHLTVNASLTLPTDYRDYEEDSEEEVEEAEEIQPPPSAPIKCCTVIAPRTCRCPADSNRWQCYNQRQQLCGDFCSAPKVAIRPASVSTWHVNDAQMLSMPPNWNAGCQMQSNCMQATERYDCSGCASGQMSSCSPYCYDYRCNSPTCAYYDQEQFCDSPQFADSVGCRPQDGWRR
ncbi:uncharacterized protein Dvir_GJ24021 [Drosophila virilis]|uniref:Chitin-binding type-2 domain-containing protein n=1 Tax=Drosophila virilis TaxID=7244 RepID=B4LZV9_DROVI|nr:uncharacterized protein Dvir_GJ24021 [Drosophila virilis]